MITEDSKTIAVDFDGTIVEHAYPEIGKEMLFAFDTLRALQKKGVLELVPGASRGIQLKDSLREQLGLPLIGRVAAGSPILAEEHILWTFRTGDFLEEAIRFCRENGIEFYAVNKNYPEEEMNREISRKIRADIFIDDRNLGGFPGWSKVWQTLYPDGTNFEHQLSDPEAHMNYKKEKGIFKSLKRIFKK